MTDQNQNQNQNQNQESQKTLVSFVVGLLIGGLIVWMFTGSTTQAPVVDETTEGATSSASNVVEEQENTSSEEGESSDDSTEPTNDESINEDDSTTTSSMSVGDGDVSVSNQDASDMVALDAVTYPMSDGWIGVAEYSSDRIGNLLGVARFSQAEGLVPESIQLLRATEPGKTYAIVFYGPSESKEFNVAKNERVDGVFATFTAE
jgi:hypothetical protein